MLTDFFFFYCLLCEVSTKGVAGAELVKVSVNQEKVADGPENCQRRAGKYAAPLPTKKKAPSWKESPLTPAEPKKSPL